VLVGLQTNPRAERAEDSCCTLPGASLIAQLRPPPGRACRFRNSTHRSSFIRPYCITARHGWEEKKIIILRHSSQSAPLCTVRRETEEAFERAAEVGAILVAQVLRSLVNVAAPG
jgi:hypothetical protein